MVVVSGMEMAAGVAASPADVDPLLAGVRRLAVLADEASDSEDIFRGLAGELLRIPGAEEIHVHHFAPPGVEQELVAVYLSEGNARLSYLLERSERAPGVGWVASSGRSLLLSDPHELTASVPRVVAAGETSCALLLPLSEAGTPRAVVMLVRRVEEPFDGRSVALAATLVEQAATALALVCARVEAGTDPVAGCMNHRAMRRRLDEEIDRAARTGSPLSCLLMDLDDFKLVNDEQGHQAGDETLRRVVQGLVGEFRAFDRVARYGGDEFVVILPNAELRSAAAAATRALERLRTVPTFDGGPPISASIGVAQWSAPMRTDELLEACDRALLRSKRQGKGRVTRAAEANGERPLVTP
jgi:diguanylate cyclase (GGDEF)-like protein